MKKIFAYLSAVFNFLFIIGPVAFCSDTVLSNMLQELCITRQSFIQADSQTHASVQSTMPSKSGGYLVLELSVKVSHDVQVVFANDFVLLSEASDGFKHSTSAKFIGLPEEPVQTSLSKSIAEMEDHIRVETGRGRFWIVFYLPFGVTPSCLHYYGAWPATLSCSVPLCSGNSRSFKTFN